MTKLPLKSCHILITRPLPQATQLAQLCKENGADCLVWPCLKILPADCNRIQNDVQQHLSWAGLAIFISPNAAHYTFGALGPVEQGQLRETPLIAVGQGTAEALKHYGCRQVYFPHQANSENVLNLDVLQNVRGKNITIFRAQSGRELIAQTLKQRGADVHYSEVYRREKLTQDPTVLLEAWQQQPFDMAICTSTEGMEVLLEQIKPLSAKLLKHTVFTVMNEKMLHLATQYKISRTLMINSAENMALVHDIKRYWHER